MHPLIGLMCFYALIAIPVMAVMLWRAHLAMNHPEKYDRYRAWEADETARQKQVFVKAAKIAAPGARAILGRILKK